MDIKDQFTIIIKENKGLIFKVSALYTNNLEERNDLSQEIVYQLWKSFGSFNQKSKLSTWMYRIALNTAIYHLKKAKRSVTTTPLHLEVDTVADEYEKLEEEKIQLLYEQIQLLNLLERGIILLYLEGKPYEEIAAIVGTTSSNVGTKISRIREKLRTQIAKKQ